MRINKKKLGMVISDEETKASNEKIKKYRADKKKIHKKNPIL